MKSNIVLIVSRCRPNWYRHLPWYLFPWIGNALCSKRYKFITSYLYNSYMVYLLVVLLVLSSQNTSIGLLQSYGISHCIWFMVASNLLCMYMMGPFLLQCYGSCHCIWFMEASNFVCVWWIDGSHRWTEKLIAKYNLIWLVCLCYGPGAHFDCL
jgi:hypothetical protein